mmetsp:Transcript_59149/g.131829  ORF Transcript_59149/g.131829 Transcript_59149/m.131829 type:complete len:371 (+) Transcript_59149:271-1383(+)
MWCTLSGVWLERRGPRVAHQAGRLGAHLLAHAQRRQVLIRGGPLDLRRAERAVVQPAPHHPRHAGRGSQVRDVYGPRLLDARGLLALPDRVREEVRGSDLRALRKGGGRQGRRGVVRTPRSPEDARRIHHCRVAGQPPSGCRHACHHGRRHAVRADPPRRLPRPATHLRLTPQDGGSDHHRPFPPELHRYHVHLLRISCQGSDDGTHPLHSRAVLRGGHRLLRATRRDGRDGLRLPARPREARERALAQHARARAHLRQGAAADQRRQAEERQGHQGQEGGRLQRHPLRHGQDAPRRRRRARAARGRARVEEDAGQAAAARGHHAPLPRNRRHRPRPLPHRGPRPPRRPGLGPLAAGLAEPLLLLHPQPA